MSLLSIIRNHHARRERLAGAREALQSLRLAIRMRCDVAPADLLDAAHAAESDLLALLRARPGAIPPALAAKLSEKSGFDLILEAISNAQAAAAALFPPSRFPRLRENVEVLVVAISLALACRTYLVQPFKIPTGSMQPTLNGVLAAPADAPGLSDRFPLSLLKLALRGERYVEVRAQASGRAAIVTSAAGEFAIQVGAAIHPIRLSIDPRTRTIDNAHSYKLHVQPGDFVTEGQLLASGTVTGGDHVFVNKLAYRFGRPERGDIVVFDTNYIPTNQPQRVAPDTFYIKRLAGLPGESISIRDRTLHADGAPVTSPFPFQRLLSDPAYDGYALQPGSRLQTPDDTIDLAPDEFLPFGDNTHSSLDGRYFGGVPLPALVGPAFFVYWPIGPHFGPCR